MKTPSISVIISTYNATEWLEKVLIGYQQQTFTDFELVIADDGSNVLTKNLIEAYKNKVNYNIIHVWQEDDGFQKSKILNKAIVACNAPYIVMSDGDCIPRADFLAVHHKHQEKGYFLSGGYFMLPLDISKLISPSDIEQQNCFKLQWLQRNGLKKSFKNNKLTATSFQAKILNTLTPTNASWNGHNASGWKEDILKVNGFDERMQYGGQDRELGERLVNNGIKSKQLRYSAIVVHLDHPRGYKNEVSILKNKGIRKQTKEHKLTWTPFGIQKSKT